MTAGGRLDCGAMRLSLVLGSAAASAAVVVALFACSSDGGSSSSGNPPLPDGATIIEDGAIVDIDGNVIPPDVSKPSKVVVTNENVAVAGGLRSYVLSVPKTYNAGKSYPLIIALHGDGQNAAAFRTFIGLDEIAGDDAIVAHTEQVIDLFTPYDQNEDQQLVEATINAVKGKYNINAGKVWGFGYSKGGFVVNQLACRKPGLFKAFAAHATGGPQEADGSVPPCPGIIGLPILLSQGSNDTNIGAASAALFWGQVDGCGTSRSPAKQAECQTFDGCPNGKTVILCEAPGVSHFPIWSAAAQVSWDFYKAL